MKVFILTLLLGITQLNILKASDFENYEKLIYLNDFQTTSLMKAVAENNIKAIDILIKNDYNINAKNIAGVSVIHTAVKNNSINALNELIKHKADLNIKDEEGFTPLMRACLDGNSQIVSILLKNNVTIWTLNDFNESALFLASISDCLDCVKDILTRDLKQYNSIEKIKLNEADKALKIAEKKENKEIIFVLKQYINSNKNYFIKNSSIENNVEKEIIDNKIIEENKNIIENNKNTIKKIDTKQNLMIKHLSQEEWEKL